MVHLYPASLYTVDRTKGGGTTPGTMGWLKAENRPAWKVQVVVGDICRLRSFSKGIYIPDDLVELWNAAVHAWMPHWPVGDPMPSKCISAIHLSLLMSILVIDLNDPNVQKIMGDRASSVRSNDCYLKTKPFFPIPKDGMSEMEAIDTTGLDRYKFIFKKRLRPAEEYHNFRIYSNMLGEHPFSKYTHKVNGIIDYFILFANILHRDWKFSGIL